MELFLLGYLNSALATYFMKKIVNTTATADVGYIEKLPYRCPTAEINENVVSAVGRIVASLQADPAADISSERDAIDDAVLRPLRDPDLTGRDPTLLPHRRQRRS